MSQKFSCKNLPTKNKVSQVTYATYFVIVVLFLLLRTLSAFGLLDFLPATARNVLSSVFIQIILMFGVALFMFSGLLKHKPKDTLKFFGYKKIPKSCWVIAIVLGVIVFFLNSYISTFFASVLQFLGFRSPSQTITSYPTWLFFLNVLLTALLPAICEGTTHRGLLLKGSLAFGTTKAIVISGLLFGLLHMNISQFFYATIIGLYLGYLAVHSDSILPGVVIHFMNNFLSTLFTFLSFHYPNFANFVDNVFSIGGRSKIVGIIFNICFVILLLIGLVYFTEKLIFNCSQKRVQDLQTHIYKDIVRQDYFQGDQKENQEPQAPEQFLLNVEDLFFDKNISLGYMTKLDREMIVRDKPFKPDALTITCIVLSTLIGVAATIFTFIWGLL